MGSGGGESKTSTQTSTPWTGVQGHLLEQIRGATNWSRTGGPEYYGGSTVAGMSPETQLAQGLTTQRALEGSPLTGAAQGQLGQTLAGEYLGQDPSSQYLTPTASGEYLGANPYLDEMFERASGKVGEQFRDIAMPGIASRFALAGRSGSGAEQQAIEGATGRLGETLSGMATDIYGRDYTQERGRQLQAAQALSAPYQAERMNMMRSMPFAGQMAQQDYADIAQLSGVGAQKEAYQQQQISADVARHTFEQNRELEMLRNYQQLLTGGQGYASQTSSQPMYQNQGAGALGGALSGAMMGASGGPWGAAIGGVGGGLMGLF